MFFKGKVWVPNSNSIRLVLIKHFHDSRCGGHSGIYQTWARMAASFIWPGMKSEVREYVLQCDVFQCVKSDSRRSSGILQPLPIPEQIWEDVTMDFIEGLPVSNVFNGLIVVVDRLSKYAHFIPLVNPYTAKSIAWLFVEYVIKLHGIPRSIITDRDRIFISNFWKEFFKMQGTQLSMSSTYHPQTDGQTVVTNRTLEQYLRCYVHQNPRGGKSLSRGQNISTILRIMHPQNTAHLRLYTAVPHPI